MRNDLDQIEAAFVGTPLAGLSIGHGPSGTVLVADIDPHRLHEARRIADALVPVIGRRPVMVTDDFDDTLRIRSEPGPGPSESERARSPRRPSLPNPGWPTVTTARSTRTTRARSSTTRVA
ncbi:hypothetical protein E1193_06455 [Micromonospora sp. KC606]|uniref:hypothetical protein n=1 Tax=Micromonospora sp. KC606 TaxID=2530379 RepID=UPI00104E970B|nr:hypothetical protein [Micromonospora sp. KC606]TDC84211.1 hypothetical protein E1193_06455 [Micromonospora sp. KC606]